MDYSNLPRDVAARGAVFNDATTKLIGRVYSDNQALPKMVSPPVVPADHGFVHDFSGNFSRRCA
jgi:hypothetical protein